MNKRIMSVVFLAVAGLAMPALTKSLPVRPLKVIAPDLVIETAEQGEFFGDPADPRHFRVTHVVPHSNRLLFGWRMKVATTRKSVLVQVRATKGNAHGLPFYTMPEYGYIFAGADIVSGVPLGKYSQTIYVEDQLVKTFPYEIE